MTRIAPRLAFIALMAASGLAHAAPPTPEVAARQFIDAWRRAFLAHDPIACGALVAADMTFVDRESGDVMDRQAFLKDLAGGKDGLKTELAPVTELRAWRAGGLLFANYRSMETVHYGTQPYRVEFRATFVIGETASGPRVHLFQATPIPNTQRAAIRLAPGTLDRYVGEYSSGPGDRLVVTREGDALWVDGGDGRRELKAADAHTFFVPTWPDDFRFVEDASGRVTGLESSSFGQVILAPRVH